MNEETVEKRRRRRSRAEAQQLVAEYEAGGLSREEFCARHGLAVSTLVRYRRRLQQPQGEVDGASRWLAVELCDTGPAAGSSGLAVALASGRRIEIGRGFDGDTLKRLLALLESL